MARTSLLGRDTELHALIALLGRALDGAGQVVVVRGEAGIGKTRLLAEVTDEAARQGAVVKMGEGRELEQALPFGAVGEAFGLSPVATDARLASLARQMRRPRAWSGELEGAPVEVSYLVEGFVEVFETTCARDPVVLVVENLHFADSSTLTLLRRLARLCPQYPVLLLLTTRPTDRPEVAALLDAATGDRGVLVDLGPLDFESICAVVAEIVRGRPGPRLRSHLERTAGNPLFAVELTAALVQAGQLTVTDAVEAEVDEVAEPTGLSVTILHRLNLLPAETVELLRTAAVLGPTIDVGELALFTGRSPVELAGPLRAAARAGLVDTVGERLAFRHDLIREALYEDWPVPVRDAMHRELGRLLAEHSAPIDRVASHLALGARPGDVEALRWVHRGGLEIAPRAPLAGAGLLARAVELALPDDPVRDVIRTDLSVALVWAGRIAEAEQLARAVVAETGSQEIRGRAAWWLASSLLNRGRAEEVQAVCRGALAAGVGSERDRILLRLTEAIATVPLQAPGLAMARMEELAADARRLGDANLSSRCLVGLEMASANEGRLAAAAQHGLEAVSEAESLSPAEMVITPAHICYSWVLEESDRLGEALSLLVHLAELAGPLPRSASAALHDTSAARVHLAAGKWDEALVDLDAALTFESDGVAAWADPLVLRATIALHRGRLEQADEDLTRVHAALAAGQSCWCLDHYFLARAFLSEARGRTEMAIEVLEGAWQIAEAVPLAMMRVRVGPHLARWSVTAGRPDTARSVAADLEALAVANPEVARLTAAARWARGIAEDNPQVILDAVGTHQQDHRPLEEGLVSEDAAAVLARAGRLDEARELMRRALDCYSEIEALQRAASARARLRRLGVRVGVRGPRRRPSSGWGSLTQAEVRVVELVAERLSNPEIAERLVVSRRTVESHVSHALAKLGHASRRELISEVRARVS